MITPFITDAQIADATLYGYQFDIGQLRAADTKKLTRQIRQGQVVKVRAYWPYFTWGTRLKTCYVQTGPQEGLA